MLHLAHATNIVKIFTNGHSHGGLLKTNKTVSHTIKTLHLIIYCIIESHMLKSCSQTNEHTLE